MRGLEEIGWVNNLKWFNRIVASGDSRAIWRWLANEEVSPYVEFVEDAFYNLRDADVDREGIIERLNSRKDIDIMLVMGAEAGILLSNAQHDTNIFVFAASNAVRSGIIDSVEDSGKDKVWAHMDEQRFERQIKAFYDIVQFKKLGMVYEDSDNARVYSAVNEVEKLAEENGFEIVRYHVREPRSPEEYPRYYQEVQDAYNKLAKEVDAVYVTIASLESEKLPHLFQPFYENKIPIFSQLGDIEVQHGALITVSVMDEVNIGRFGADNISKCLLGAKPRQLEQSFQSAPVIILNSEVAKKIDFKLPFELLIVVDKAYKDIEGL
ncbi:ABC transporter substrate-binding protein [Desulfofalx alkaliphila]|uniref:ABC transporter substrate-binding protein n=1 Tax=Desulfofalx alkaliphila TaxID=105483 RepID=UPI0004E1DF9A|nr:ABC transporter substrate binding protein [Desulfofalx alkaliphila]